MGKKMNESKRGGQSKCWWEGIREAITYKMRRSMRLERKRRKRGKNGRRRCENNFLLLYPLHTFTLQKLTLPNVLSLKQ
jgi:hypothetical protein